MDRDVLQQHTKDVETGNRCHSWLVLETTEEFLAPLRAKANALRSIDLSTLLTLDDKSFRSKVEASFLAAKEIDDYFAYLNDLVNVGRAAQDSLKDGTGDEY